MRETIGPPLRAAAMVAFILGLVMLFLNPPDFGGVGQLLAVIAGALAIVLVTAWVTVAMIGHEAPEEEFQELEDRSEQLAALPPPEFPPTEFDLLVMRALDGLPDEFRARLHNTPVVVSHLGREHHAYGHYMGGTIARNEYANRIVIYQDTLVRDFGHDPDLLRAQVERTVRHEVAHHLGWDEGGVRGLGL